MKRSKRIKCDISLNGEFINLSISVINMTSHYFDKIKVAGGVYRK